MRITEPQRSLLGMWSATVRGASLPVLAGALDPALGYVVVEDVEGHSSGWQDQGGIPGFPGRTRRLRFDLLVAPDELSRLSEWLELHTTALFLWQSGDLPPADQSLRPVSGRDRLRLAEALGINLFLTRSPASGTATLSSPSPQALDAAMRRLDAAGQGGSAS